ncbi:hypothetical protein [Aliikangiella coralliicola]|uniref:Uncharacterized protein n=1 Tax=Aliikangiella coralliicola TaxID=2592383 RepID=A0A545UCS7_9GAMM|nr:hypothetical protein [Aliikangiella coralliicola]TQV87271.1 hypothetical protein FLL46_12525 [Aliikangiella coralliicola]
MNQEQRKEYVHIVATELEDYFHNNARATDLESLTNWWLAKNRVREAPKLIREALDELILARKIGKRIYQGREIFERLSSRKNKLLDAELQLGLQK